MRSPFFSDPPGALTTRRTSYFVLPRFFLSAFVPGDREETPRSSEGSALQALQLMNNAFVTGRLNTNLGTGTLSESLQLADDALVENLYLSVLSREPTDEELAFGVNHLNAGDRSTQAASLMWAMLNKTDFYFNY